MSVVLARVILQQLAVYYPCGQLPELIKTANERTKHLF